MLSSSLTHNPEGAVLGALCQDISYCITVTCTDEEKLSLSSGLIQRCCLWSLLYSIVLEVPASATEEKEIYRVRNRD